MTATARAWVASVLAVGVLITAGCTGDPEPAPSEVIARPPSPGTVTETVSAPPVQPPKEAELDDEVTLADGLQVAIAAVESREVNSPLPGEGGGPAVVVTIAITNGQNTAYSTSQLEISVLDSQGYAAERINADPARPLPTSLDVGASAEGVYVFLVAEEHRDPITITVSGAPGEQPVEFSGAVPA